MPEACVTEFDTWIRGRFKDLNTELEDRYFVLENPAAVEGIETELKAALLDEGHHHVAAIAALPVLDFDADAGYDLLGSLGMYMAALRRHELTNPAREDRSPFPEASSLAQRLASGLGVAPRFATAQINLRNAARLGTYKSFTWLPDELLFIDYNCLGILAYIRAADVLRRIPPLGATHPIAVTLFGDAEAALVDVARYNDELDAKLDVRRFFYSVRPYFKPYRVGRHEYRGANAGDFAAINEIDLLLGLCRVGDPSYAGIVLEKMPFMTAEDQTLLQACVRKTSLMDELLAVLDTTSASDIGPVVENIRAFVRVCEAHGHTARLHQDRLVRRFIAEPAEELSEQQPEISDQYLRQITASGPPLPILLRALEDLRDKRLAAPRDDIETRYADLERLRAACGASTTAG